MRILAEGYAPASILAITFTRKAAAEIIDRLHKSLKDAAEGNKRETSTEEKKAPKKSQEFWQNLRHRILLAHDPKYVLQVHTFHGWFASLRTYWPRKNRVLSVPDIVADTEELFEESWMNWQRHIDHNTSPALSEVLTELPTSSLKDLCRDYIEKLPAWLLAPERGNDAVEFEAKIADAQKEMRKAAADFALTPGSSITIEKARSAAKRLADGAEKTAEEAQKGILTKENAVDKRLFNAAKKAGSAETLSCLGEKIIKVLTLDEEMRAANFDSAAREVCREFGDEWERVLKARQQVTFNDLEMNTWFMLKDNSCNAMLDRMYMRYQHILIDEFQDTSPLQWQIVRSLLLELHGDDAPSVFIVGDVKQAIYGFRHSDWRLFDVAAQFLREYYGAEEPERRNISYRCAEEIIKMVNKTFAKPDNNQERLVKFSAHKSKPSAIPSGYVEWHGVPSSKKDDSEEDRKKKIKKHKSMRWPLDPPDSSSEPMHKTRSIMVAEKVQEILDTWEIPDRDKSDGSRRRCLPEDILILVRSSTHAAEQVEELARNGIPCSSEGFFESFECEDMLDLAKSLLSPHRDYPLARVLRSPVFSTDDEALVALVAASGESLWDKLQNSDDPRLERARRLLNLWRIWASKPNIPAHDLLARIFHEGDIIARYIGAVSPQRKDHTAANLTRFLDLSVESVETFKQDRRGQPLLGQFVTEMRRRAMEKSDPPPSPNSIRLLTIHKAKGLEAPVVILADLPSLNRKHNDRTDMLISWPPDSSCPDRCVISLRKDSCAYSKIKEEAQEREHQEEANVLYVALTRALYALVIFGPEMPKERDLGEWVKEAMQDLSEGSGDNNFLCFGESFKKDDSLPGEKRSAQTTDAASDATGRQPKTPPPARPDRTETAQRPAAAVRGTIRHRIAALLATKIQPDLARRLAPGEPAQWKEAGTMLETPELNKILQGASEALLEREFSIDGDFVRIDLVALGDKESWVVDYKGGGSDPKKHREQLRKYRDVVHKEFDTPVRVAILDAAGKFTEVNDL